MTQTAGLDALDMRLFLYGTLLDPGLLVALTGRTVTGARATLHGWRRVAFRNGRYPTLRRARGRVEGTLVTVDQKALAQLATYEGPSYRLSRVVVHTARGATTAHTWIARVATSREWPVRSRQSGGGR